MRNSRTVQVPGLGGADATRGSARHVNVESAMPGDALASLSARAAAIASSAFGGGA
jgi:hypothetical protein